MKLKQNKIVGWLKVPPWIIASIALGTLALGLGFFVRDFHRERGHLEDIFIQRGEALISSLEMVGRVRFAENWEENHLLTFWHNLEDDANVLFLALTDEKGAPLVVTGDIKLEDFVFSDWLLEHNIDDSYLFQTQWHLSKIDGHSLFVVYRSFWPNARPPQNRQPLGHHGGRGRMGRGGDNAFDRTQQPFVSRGAGVSLPEVRYLWVGFDMSVYEKITQRRLLMGGIFIGLFALAALGGVLALFWGYNSRLAHKLYKETNAMAAELIGRLPIGVILKNNQGEVTVVNQATETISGLRATDFMGATLSQLTLGLFPKDEVMNGREIDLSFEGGNKVHVALTSAPVISEDGRNLGAVVLMEDLGELGRLKAELAKNEHLAALGSLA
ncbi:MAG: PAS domain-containing protein, partial [Candidatus Adiutrix sp.]